VPVSCASVWPCGERDLALIEAFLTNVERLAVAPVRGTCHEDLLPGMRHLALDQAIDWIQVCAEAAEISPGVW